jgi:hypothetical protein
MLRCLELTVYILFAAQGRPQAAPGLDEAQFHQVLDAIERVYAPVVAKRSKQLVIERQWADDDQNATPFIGATIMGLTISGGIARARGMTQDGFALVACHELGHLLGGLPQSTPGMSSEGQADYFATAKCLRRVFESPLARLFSRLPAVDPTAKKACARVFGPGRATEVCIRTAMAALSVSPATVGWGHEPEASFDTPDGFRTMVTDDRHMPRQCRLDTQFQGALCAKPATDDFSETDPVQGACTQSERFTVGLRPRCWYQPSDFEAVPSAE